MTTTESTINFYSWVVTAFKIALSFASSLWLAADFDIRILCILSVVDMALGFINKQIRFRDQCKRIAYMFILVLTVHWTYQLAKLPPTSLNLGFDISALVSGFYCLGEAISILKACSGIIDLPPQLLELLGKAEGLTGSEKREILALRLKQSQETVALDLKITQSKDTESKIVKP